MGKIKKTPQHIRFSINCINFAANITLLTAVPNLAMRVSLHWLGSIMGKLAMTVSYYANI